MQSSCHKLYPCKCIDMNDLILTMPFSGLKTVEYSTTPVAFQTHLFGCYCDITDFITIPEPDKQAQRLSAETGEKDWGI
jgi:hypothetical protein